MTSVRQTSANQRNAMRSTGPTSAAGRAVASQNARRHGLTATAGEVEVQRWLRVILNCETLPPPEAFLRDEGLWLARALAEAEAHLAALRGSLDRETGSIEHGDPQPAAYEKLCVEMGEFLEAAIQGTESLEEVLLEAERRTKIQRQFMRNTRLAGRYLREARAARRAALKYWVTWQREHRS